MSDGHSHLPIALFHILAVVPFFLYVAFVRGQLVPWVFTVLMSLGIVILVYHAYKSFVKWRANSFSLWVNLVHVLVVAPLLIYIGKQAYDTPRWAYEVLAMVAFAALGYHLLTVVREVQEMNAVKKE